MAIGHERRQQTCDATDHDEWDGTPRARNSLPWMHSTRRVRVGNVLWDRPR